MAVAAGNEGDDACTGSPASAQLVYVHYFINIIDLLYDRIHILSWSGVWPYFKISDTNNTQENSLPQTKAAF